MLKVEQTLGVVLYDQFSGRQGQTLVRKGRYVVQDAATGRDLSPRVPFNTAVRPGQTLYMAMLFHPLNQTKTICPRCQRVVNSSSELDTEWYVISNLRWLDLILILKLYPQLWNDIAPS